MAEVLKPIPPSDCGQLNGKTSCEGCPVYLEAIRVVNRTAEGSIDRIQTYCPPGAKMQSIAVGWGGWAAKIGARW